MNIALYNSKAGFAFALSRVLAGVGAVLLAASAVALPDALIVAPLPAKAEQLAWTPTTAQISASRSTDRQRRMSIPQGG